jgi:MFS family permease
MITSLKACEAYKHLFPQAKLELQQLVSRVHSEQEMAHHQSGIGTVSSWKMFFKPQVLKPVAIVNVFNLIQIVSGTYLVIFYAVNLISETGNGAGSIDTFLVAVLTAVCRLIFIIIACILLLWVGRRPLALFSGVGSSAAALGVGTFLYCRYPSSESSDNWIVTGFILAYVATNTIGFFVLPGIAIGELLPVKIRGSFGGYIFAIFNLSLFFVAKIFPSMLHVMGSYGVFWMFGISSLFGTLFVFLFFPETKGKTLEEIEDYFTEKNVLWLTRKKHQNVNEPLKV